MKMNKIAIKGFINVSSNESPTFININAISLFKAIDSLNTMLVLNSPTAMFDIKGSIRPASNLEQIELKTNIPNVITVRSSIEKVASLIQEATQ